MNKFFIKTYGCQMNVSDSEIYKTILTEKGYCPTDLPADADIIIFNTCSVRQHAEDKAMSNLGRLKKLKEKKPNLKIVIAGCIAQRLKDEIWKKFPYVDIIIGPQDIGNFGEILEYIEKYPEQKVISTQGKDSLVKLTCPLEKTKSFFVPIMRGCNNFCSYCIVPFVRGREVSYPYQYLISFIKSLAEKGVENIVLLGQNVNSYCDQDYSFIDLLKGVDRIEGIKTINFLTSHPKDFSFEIIETIKNSSHISHYFHLPVQSGSDEILDKMNRKYTRRDYLKIIKEIRKQIPDAIISTDIIVGYPGETEKDFLDTVSLVEECKFESAYIFKYSVRPQSLASKEKDDISAETKTQRLMILQNLIREMNNEIIREEKKCLKQN